MFRLKSRITAVRTGESTLVIRTSNGRRVLFGVTAAFLVVAFFVGVDWELDFVDGLPAGMVFFFGVLAICTGVAGWKSSVAIDSAARTVRFRKQLFGIGVQEQAFSVDDVSGVVLQGIRFLKDSERPQPGLLNNRMRDTIARRNVYYKLFLETSQKRHLIEDSTDADDLDSAAQSIAAFLNLPVKHEEH